MKHRGLARLAVAAGAVLAGAVMAANPAAATDDLPIGFVTLEPVPVKAADFATKSCEGIPGGAKVGTDGWVFSKPSNGATEYGYIFGLINDKQELVVLGVDKDGATGLKLPAAQLQGLKAGKLSSGEAKSLAKAAEENAPSGGVEVIPAPEGVAGGLTATGEGWLQTPAGWLLGSGALVQPLAVGDGSQESAPAVRTAPEPEHFSLLRVCAPKVVTPAPTATTAPGTGGGNGQSLPVTGTNVAVLTGAGVLLVGVGAGLFVMRRRRDTTKFVA